MDLTTYVIIALAFKVIWDTIKFNRQKDKYNEEKLDYQVSLARMKEDFRNLNIDFVNLQDELGKERDKNRIFLSQKKSNETRLGMISENLVPFLENCPYNPHNMTFLGSPIDFLVFNFDDGSITFLEVKSGNSRPSKRQKIIKNIIKTGRVYYAEIRINKDGVKHKLHENLDNSTVGIKNKKTDK